MNKVFYRLLYAILLALWLLAYGCTAGNKLTSDDRKNGVIIKSKRAVVYKGNLSKYSYFGNRKNKKQ